MLLEICALSKMYRCISKNLNIVKKFFFNNISKSEIFIYSRLITRKVKHLRFFFFFFMITAYSSWNSKIQYLKLLECFLRSIKKRICKTEQFKFFKVGSFMLSILGRGSFSTNFSISEVWHGRDQSVALLRHYWGLFMLTGQSSTAISSSANHLEVVLALWAGAKVLLES